MEGSILQVWSQPNRVELPDDCTSLVRKKSSFNVVWMRGAWNSVWERQTKISESWKKCWKKMTHHQKAIMICLVGPLRQSGLIRRNKNGHLFMNPLEGNSPPLPLSYAPDYDDLCNGLFSTRSRKFTVYFNFNNFSIFHMSKKLLRSIYDTEFSNMRSFIRICRKLMNIWDLKLANFLQNLVWSIERRGYISLKETKNGKV